MPLIVVSPSESNLMWSVWVTTRSTMQNPQRSSLPWSNVFLNTQTIAKCLSWSIYFLCAGRAVISGVVLLSDFFKAFCYEESILDIIKTRSWTFVQNLWENEVKCLYVLSACAQRTQSGFAEMLLGVKRTDRQIRRRLLLAEGATCVRV